MQADFELLSHMPLFEGIAIKDFPALLACVGASSKAFARGEFVSLAGDSIQTIGVVLSGQVQVLKEDVFGNRAVLNSLGPGEVFGESFICGGRYALTVSVQAAQASRVLFLAFDRVMSACESACAFHNMLIKNMVAMLALKNIRLVEKLEVTTKHSLREKVLTYLSQLAQAQQSAMVIAPLGRMDLAGFLGVDRSALTRELNRMQEDGLLEYDRNTYRLLGTRLPG